MVNKPKYRIGTAMVVILIALAFIADLIGLIPFAKDITASLFWIFFRPIWLDERSGPVQW
jgi:hypothetical protein